LQAERPAACGQLAHRDVGGGRLTQAVSDDGPAHEQDERGDGDDGLAPSISGNDRTYNEHRQERAADADAGVRAAEREAELSVEPRRDGLQVAEGPEAEARERHDRPPEGIDGNAGGAEL